jgi:hypothetical protein
MSTVWAQRREDLLSDCIVSPDVFNQMVDRLDDFVVPFQHVLETEACQHPWRGPGEMGQNTIVACQASSPLLHGAHRRRAGVASC